MGRSSFGSLNGVLSQDARVEQALAPLALGAKAGAAQAGGRCGFLGLYRAARQPPVRGAKGGRTEAPGRGRLFRRAGRPEMAQRHFAGVFTTEDAAKSRLAALRAKGVKSATIGARETQLGPHLFSGARGQFRPWRRS